MDEQLKQAAKELEGEIVALSRQIHQHPEVGFEEHQAQAWCCQLLERHGFAVEKGAGGIWTMLPDDTLELFFSMQGFWTLPKAAARAYTAAELPKGTGRLRRAEPEEYERQREKLLQGKNHIVAGNLVAALQQAMAARRGGGMFLMELHGAPVCAIAAKNDAVAQVWELLCPEQVRGEALALLAEELHAARCVVQSGCGILRLLNRFAELKRPEGYLGCGALL